MTQMGSRPLQSGLTPVGSPASVAVVGGTGAQGRSLALRWARAGLTVRIGSRNASRAQAAARELRRRLEACGATPARISGHPNTKAIQDVPVVVLTIPAEAQAATLRGLREALQPGQVVLDVTVPLATAIGGPATRTVGLWAGSAAEQAAALVPDGVSVCAAFHHVASSLLDDLDSAVETDVLVCGDSREAKQRVRPLVDALPGARFVDAGPLERARFLEPLAALLIALNVRYRSQRAGIRITGIELNRS